MSGRYLAQSGKKALDRRNYAHVRRDRLNNYRSDSLAVFLEELLDSSEIVVRRIQRKFSQRLRDTRRCRDAQRSKARTAFGQKTIIVPVVAAFELDDEVSAGRRARQTNRAHGCLCAGTDETHALHRGQRFLQHLGQFDLDLRGHAVARAARRLLRQSRRYLWVRVSQNQGTPGANEIRVGIAVDVPNPSSLRAVDDHGHAAHRAKSSHGTIDAADQHEAGALENLLRTAVLFFRDASHAQVLLTKDSIED